jgi:hypothetical protein
MTDPLECLPPLPDGVIRETALEINLYDSVGPGNAALFSADGVYRYVLTRQWAAGSRVCCWIMLNPSTADAQKNDPTVARCIKFSQRWGFAAIAVLNLFALRATNPAELKRHANAVGEHNDLFIDRVVQICEQPIVCAWGEHGRYQRRDRLIARRLRAAGIKLACLGETKAGRPRHPLYLRTDIEPQGF